MILIRRTLLTGLFLTWIAWSFSQKIYSTADAPQQRATRWELFEYLVLSREPNHPVMQFFRSWREVDSVGWLSERLPVVVLAMLIGLTSIALGNLVLRVIRFSRDFSPGEWIVLSWGVGTALFFRDRSSKRAGGTDIFCWLLSRHRPRGCRIALDEELWSSKFFSPLLRWMDRSACFTSDRFVELPRGVLADPRLRCPRVSSAWPQGMVRSGPNHLLVAQRLHHVPVPDGDVLLPGDDPGGGSFHRRAGGQTVLATFGPMTGRQSSSRVGASTRPKREPGERSSISPPLGSIDSHPFPMSKGRCSAT